MQAGKLREKFIIEKPTWAKAASGAETATYTVFAVVHGSLKWDSATEQIESGQATAQRQGTISIRYLKNLDETYRIKWGTKYLSIISIDDIENRHREMVLKVRQYVS